MPSLVSPRNDVWETSLVIPYRWRAIAQIFVVLLIGRASTNQKHYSDLGSDASSVWNFCARFHRPHFTGKLVMASWNVRLVPSSRLINTASSTGETLKNRLTWNESPTCSDGFVIKKISSVGLPCSTCYKHLWWIYFTRRNQVVTHWSFFLLAGT